MNTKQIIEIHHRFVLNRSYLSQKVRSLYLNNVSIGKMMPIRKSAGAYNLRAVKRIWHKPICFHLQILRRDGQVGQPLSNTPGLLNDKQSPV